MPSQESPDSTDADPARAVSERPPEGAKKKKAKRPKPPLPRTETEIDSPDRVTLLMLGIMGFMTIVLWAFAKGGCNYHPPRETRRPRAVKLEELARDPKDAALEMQQRLVQYDFDGALELTTGSAENDVKRRKADCATNVKACAESKKANERVATSAALLERDMASAVVRATSTTAPKQVNIVRLERNGPTWKVVSFAPDDGSFKPKTPTLELGPGPLGAAPAAGPTGSVSLKMVPTPDASGAVKMVPAPGVSGTLKLSPPKASAGVSPKPAAPSGSASP
jgi:hypothetical protein